MMPSPNGCIVGVCIVVIHCVVVLCCYVVGVVVL